MVGLLTLFSMTKIWAEAFWKPHPDGDDRSLSIGDLTVGERVLLVGPIVVFAALTVVIGLWTQPFLDLATRASGELLNPARLYRRGPGGTAMTLFMLNLALAIIWQAVTGTFSLGGLAVGFCVGYAVLWIARPMFGDTRYFVRLWRIIGFFFYFLKEMVVSSLRVAYDVPDAADPLAAGRHQGADPGGDGLWRSRCSPT